MVRESYGVWGDQRHLVGRGSVGQFGLWDGRGCRGVVGFGGLAWQGVLGGSEGIEGSGAAEGPGGGWAAGAQLASPPLILRTARGCGSGSAAGLCWWISASTTTGVRGDRGAGRAQRAQGSGGSGCPWGAQESWGVGQPLDNQESWGTGGSLGCWRSPGRSGIPDQGSLGHLGVSGGAWDPSGIGGLWSIGNSWGFGVSGWIRDSGGIGGLWGLDEVLGGVLRTGGPGRSGDIRWDSEKVLAIPLMVLEISGDRWGLWCPSS